MPCSKRFYKNLCCCMVCFIILSGLIALSVSIQYTQDDDHQADCTTCPEHVPREGDVHYLVQPMHEKKTAMITGTCDDTIIPTATTLIQNNATVILACNHTDSNIKSVYKQPQLNGTNGNQPNLFVKWNLNPSNLSSIDEFISSIKSEHPSLSLDIVINNINMNYNNILGHFYLVNKLTELMANSSQMARVINIVSNTSNDTHIILMNEYNKRHNNKSVYAVNLQKEFGVVDALRHATTMGDGKYMQFGTFLNRKNKWRKHSLYRNMLENGLGEQLWNRYEEMVRQKGFVI